MRLTMSRINYDLRRLFQRPSSLFTRQTLRRIFRSSGLREYHTPTGSRGQARRRRFRLVIQLEQGSLGGARAGSEAA